MSKAVKMTTSLAELANMLTGVFIIVRHMNLNLVVCLWLTEHRMTRLDNACSCWSNEALWVCLVTLSVLRGS